MIVTLKKIPYQSHSIISTFSNQRINQTSPTWFLLHKRRKLFIPTNQIVHKGLTDKNSSAYITRMKLSLQPYDLSTSTFHYSCGCYLAYSLQFPQDSGLQNQCAIIHYSVSVHSATCCSLAFRKISSSWIKYNLSTSILYYLF